MAMISNLRDVAHFGDAIADRGWHEWWTDTGVSLADYSRGIKSMAVADGIPCAFVAHDVERYVGSVLLIESDLVSRMHYTPWIAALWVDPEFRGRGVAYELITKARQEAARLGHATCYLCATPGNSDYYLARGFQLLETGVEELNVFSI